MKHGRYIWLFLAALFFICANPAAATTWAPPTKITCAVGGEEFMFETIASYVSYGQRLDGMPIASGLVHLRRPQCPTNHFVDFQSSYTPDEITRLTIIVNSTEFKEAVAANAPQSYLLFLQLDRGNFDKYMAAYALLQTTWLEVIDTELLREYVAYVDALPPNSDELIVFHTKVSAMNAQRELGNFEDAAQRLAQIRTNLPSDNPARNFKRDEVISILGIYENAIRERDSSLYYSIPDAMAPRHSH